MKQNMDDFSCDYKESRAIPHAGPGIMLLTDSMKLLYKDRRAWELCQQIIRCQDVKTANGVLPPAVMGLVDHIRKMGAVASQTHRGHSPQLRPYLRHGFD